ncbi:MAG: outer membrane lipoprotein LolB [Halomonadaceae bacterium]|nr:MAG: outer membrane lipoprotein LolB [Halomonadaceae bacterium]
MPVRHLLPAVLLSSLLLQACVTAPPPPDQDHTRTVPSDWADRQQRLADFNQWSLQGKIAVRQSDRNDTGVVRSWDQSGEEFSLTVSSSFMGMGSTRLEGTPDYLTITTPNGEQLFSEDPEGLIRQALGWELPIAALAYWVRGMPAPGDDHELYFDDQGRLGYVVQSGWEIYYENHQPLGDNGEGPVLPRRLTASNDDALVRLVVTGWEKAD